MIESIPVLVLLCVLSLIDIKKREVPHWGVLALFTYALFTVEQFTASLFWGISAFIGLFVLYLVTKGGIGGGDVKLLTVLGFYFGSFFPVYLGFLSLTAGIGFLAGFIFYRRMKFSLPMVPLMFLAFIMTFLLFLQGFRGLGASFSVLGFA